MEIMDLKEALRQMYEICDEVAERTNFHEQTGLRRDASLSDVLKMNLLFYLSYLAASDGVVSWKESRFIGELIDINLTPAKLQEIIDDNNLYSTEFESDPPMILQIFVALDNAMYQHGKETNIEMGKAVFELFKFLTIGLVEANGRTAETMDDEEKEDAQTYLGMMQNYIDEKTESHHTDIILDHGKDRERKRRDDEEHSSEGVQAPRKRQGTTGSVTAPRKRA